MNNQNSPWLKTNDEKLQALLADDAKNKAMIAEMERTLGQLKAKNTFRLALLNSIIEDNQSKGTNK